MKKLIMILALAGLVVPTVFPVRVYAEDQKVEKKKKKISKSKSGKKKVEQSKKKQDDAPAGDKR